ncbi:hypothetical protein Tco_0803086 [Tanacetum coccineum]|uniref:Uncharacterized protein n=1 Tax=Tanacetum coccineum TaxID=301880 RepID=A0ABQ5A0S2_9ASTR
MRKVGKGFSGRDTPLFPIMMVQAKQEQCESLAMPIEPQHTPTIIQPSTSQPQKKQRSRRPKRKDTDVPQPSGPITNVADEAVYEEIDDSLVRVATTASSLEAEQDNGNIDKTRSKAKLNEPNTQGTGSRVNIPRSDEDRLKLNELMEFFKKLDKKGGSRTHKLKRLYKVGRSTRVISSDEASLGDQEDASKHGRKIDDIDKDAEITLVDKTQGRYGDEEMFDTCVLDDDEEKSNVVEEPSESITTTPTLTTTTTTTVTAASTRPNAKGLVIHEEEQATTPTVSSQQPSQVTAHDKGKGIMVEEPMKMKKKDQISLDKELAFKLQAEEEEERLAREKAQREEEANIVSWDNVQAMIDADYQMAQQIQAEEQEKLSIEEKTNLFVQLLEARKKHFAEMRAQEIRNKPPTKAQKRNTMSTYLKNMAGYKHNQLKNKSFDDIQKLFDKAMKRVNTFIDMDTKLVEGSKVRAEGSDTTTKGSSKRAGEDLQQESIKKQKVDEDKETAEL